MLLVPATQPDVLGSSSVEFVVALACAAADKEQLNLEKFVGDKLANRIPMKLVHTIAAGATGVDPPSAASSVVVSDLLPDTDPRVAAFNLAEVLAG